MNLDQKVLELVYELRALGRQDRRTIVFRTGQLVIDRLYGGELDAWRKRGRTERRYALLEGHPALPMTADELCRSVQIYELCHRFPRVITSKLVTLSHLVAMLPLDASSQERLLECAEQGRWKVRRMRQEVARHLAATPPATGRPKKPPVYRTLTGLGSKSAFDGKDELLAFDDSKVATLLRHCNHALGELGEVRSFLEEAVSKREPARVLVVSSDRAFLYRARQRLRLPGCRIHVAASCEEAMLRMDSATRCAVIDPFLVDGCGLELAERLTAACRDLQCFLTDRPKSRLSKKLDADPARSPIVRKASGLWPLRVALAKALSARERNGSKPARITR